MSCSLKFEFLLFVASFGFCALALYSGARLVNPTTAALPPTEVSGTPAPTREPGAPVIVNVTAKNILFNVRTITVPRSAQVTVNFDNQDAGVLHNVAFYTDRTTRTKIYVGAIFDGIATREYRFQAPASPGSYFFRCDVHPDTMTGTFVVQSEGETNDCCVRINGDSLVPDRLADPKGSCHDLSARPADLVGRPHETTTTREPPAKNRATACVEAVLQNSTHWETQAQMSRDCWLDETYVSRLLRGERTHPSRDALILLAAFGLELPLHLTDEVLIAADYKPLAFAGDPLDLRSWPGRLARLLESIEELKGGCSGEEPFVRGNCPSKSVRRGMTPPPAYLYVAPARKTPWQRISPRVCCLARGKKGVVLAGNAQPHSI